MLLNAETTLRTVAELVQDRPLMFAIGIVTLFAGLAMVLVHNVWSGGALPVVVTLVGWLTLSKAVLILLMPHAAANLYQLNARMIYVSAGLSAVLGAYLTWRGFARQFGRD
jgi:hypothetical protein